MFSLASSGPLIGVIHLAPTPGTPMAPADPASAMAELLERATADARAYAAGGVSSLVVENFHDAPFYSGSVLPETVAALTLAAAQVAAVPGIDQLGINVLRNDVRSGLGVAAAAGAGFVRVNVHTGMMYTDQGPVVGEASHTLRTRRSLCPSVAILADVHVKHATPVPGEALEDAARDAVLRGRADALIVSGVATGSAPDPDRVGRVRAAVGDGVPLLIGSGFSMENARELLAHADGAIVGTAVKRGGDVREPVDPDRVAELVALAGAGGTA